MEENKLSKKLSKFEGCYLSGFFMTDPAMLTSMGLLFEKVYLPNQLEIVIDISKKYKISTSSEKNINFNFERIEGKFKFKENPLEKLTEDQQKTAKHYLMMAHQFCIDNHELFPSFFETDLLKNNEVFSVKLIEKGENGNLNKYQVKKNPLFVTTEGVDQLEKRIRNGSVPLIGVDKIKSNILAIDKIPDKSIAALLAMQSIEMVLPSMIGVEPCLILEARDKLSDHLPQFWSAMLKFSQEGKNVIKNCKNIEEAIFECQNIVDVSIRPVLIDLNEKIIRDKKNWFYRILSPVGDKLKFVIGRPNISNLDLLTASMSLATDVTIDYVQHKRKLNELKDEAGLTYLIKLGQQIN
ncbi:hypothetical protein [Flavobacterium ovatum]|uniref:hypothetical protein n=1 Tax=Flavobacterium ovatum TaxID=1928857 RepID=UPI00344C26ED